MSDDHWHRPLFQIRSGELTGDTVQTSGMTRWEAVSGKSVGAEKLWMGQTHVAAGAKSGNHHHGEAETAIYVVSGTPAFPCGLTSCAPARRRGRRAAGIGGAAGGPEMSVLAYVTSAHRCLAVPG